MVEFGEQLRRAREEKGMTQQSLAEQLYVTRQAVPETYGKNHIPTGIYSIGAMENYLKKAPYDRADLESYIPV